MEVCPTSNIQVDVFDKIENHTADHLFNSGISMSINTDARTISDVTLTDEYQLMHNVFNWNKAHFKKCNLEAIEHSFATDQIKQKIRTQLESTY